MAYYLVISVYECSNKMLFYNILYDNNLYINRRNRASFYRKISLYLYNDADADPCYKQSKV